MQRGEDMRRRRFWHDDQGTSFEGIALFVTVIAVTFVASADMLDYVTKSRHVAPRSETAAASLSAPPLLASTAGANLDETPTGSLPKLITRTVLDPCTGAPR